MRGHSFNFIFVRLAHHRVRRRASRLNKHSLVGMMETTLQFDVEIPNRRSRAALRNTFRYQARTVEQGHEGSGNIVALVSRIVGRLCLAEGAKFYQPIMNRVGTRLFAHLLYTITATNGGSRTGRFKGGYGALYNLRVRESYNGTGDTGWNSFLGTVGYRRSVLCNGKLLTQHTDRSLVY